MFKDYKVICVADTVQSSLGELSPLILTYLLDINIVSRIIMPIWKKRRQRHTVIKWFV